MNKESIRNLLTEEKWTRATITNYSIPSFQELDAVLDAVTEADDLLEIKKICDEYLEKNKNSIVAMYLTGAVSLKRRSLDYGTIITLIESFNENKKYGIVEYLSKKVLSLFDDKYVIRILAESYAKQ